MKVAVVGSGVSGLGATWLLNEHSDHEVHLYESDSRPGGHANTVRYVPRFGNEVDVDTGFIVCNPDTYPNFLRFLRMYPYEGEPPYNPDAPFRTKDQADQIRAQEGIQILPTEMTFSVSRDGGAFEWAGKNLSTIFCQRRRLLDPQMWRMIYDVLRFNVCARRVLVKAPVEGEAEMSIGEYLSNEGYSAAFRNNYLIPMTAAIWSTPPNNCFLDFPARTLIQFLYNHNLLQITGKPSWLTIWGGSHKYVKKILAKLPPTNLHLSTGIKSVRNLPAAAGEKPKVMLTTEYNEEIEYDHVILACHSDTTLDILRAGGITSDEERILSEFDWNRNEAILHSDRKLMPRDRRAWSCWNYLSFTTPAPSSDSTDDSLAEKDIDDLYPEKSNSRGMSSEVNRVSLTYGMNDLQHIAEQKCGYVFVTLNPPFEPEADKIAGRWKYDHPVLDTKAVRAQNEMHKIQNKRSISYAGAYLKYGFHEDGFTSGLLAACSLDDDPNSPSSTVSTGALNSSNNGGDLTIPTKNVSVRPPFAIQHADHHTRLGRRGWQNVGYEMMALFFVCFEGSGLREVIGSLGSVVLAVLGGMLGLGNVDN